MRYEGPWVPSMERLSDDAREAIRSTMFQACEECTDADPSPELVARIASDWESFREKAEAMGFDADEHIARVCEPDEGGPWGYAAHDFILTRNHHGAGFWDAGRWHSPWGERLTNLCREFGEIELYLGDDGMVYA
jgi:hypothetical protein